MRSTAQDKHLPVERVLFCQNLHILIHRYNLSLTIINDCINNAKQQINQLLKPTAECTIVHLVYIIAENQHIVGSTPGLDCYEQLNLFNAIFVHIQ